MKINIFIILAIPFIKGAEEILRLNEPTHISSLSRNLNVKEIAFLKRIPNYKDIQIKSDNKLHIIGVQNFGFDNDYVIGKTPTGKLHIQEIHHDTPENLKEMIKKIFSNSYSFLKYVLDSTSLKTIKVYNHDDTLKESFIEAKVALWLGFETKANIYQNHAQKDSQQLLIRLGNWISDFSAARAGFPTHNLPSTVDRYFYFDLEKEVYDQPQTSEVYIHGKKSIIFHYTPLPSKISLLPEQKDISKRAINMLIVGEVMAMIVASTAIFGTAYAVSEVEHEIKEK